MIRNTRKEMNPLQLGRRVLPLVVATAVLAGSLTSASAIGKRSKPWERKAKTEQASTPTANVASSTTTKKRKLFGRMRDNRENRRAAAAAPKPRPTNSRVSVRATAQTATPVANTKPQRKKRDGLLARMFKPEPLKKKPVTASVAVQKKTVAVPHPGQAPPKYNYSVMSQAKSKGSNVVINIARQRAYVYVGGQVAIDTQDSTARKGKYTPRGTFSVGQRVRQGKISTIYHVAMPYWMRLGSTAYGMHAGYLPGYPASAGCIRMPYEAAQKVFDTTKHGTRVKITSG